MKVLPDIEFEGVIVKPKNGVYWCPFNCSKDSGYPMKKWKTEKGFKQHIEKCPKSPKHTKLQDERKKIKDDKENEKILLFEKMKEQFLLTLPYKIGQTIYYIYYRVTKPTHEWKWKRLVRVRYEEERYYSYDEETIKSIDFVYRGYIPNEIEHMKNYLLFNNKVSLSSLCNSLEEAKIKSSELSRIYKEGCMEASSYR